MTIFLFSSLGIFALILGLFPYGEFTENTTPDWQSEYMTDKEAGQIFEQANVTVYANIESFNYTFGAAPEVITAGLPSGHSVWIWWRYELPATSRYDRVWIEHHWPGFIISNVEFMQLFPPYDSFASEGRIAPDNGNLYKTGLEAAYGNKIINASYFEWFDTAGLKLNMFVGPYNDTWTITESWNNQNLSFTVGYDIDWNQTGLNAFNLMWQIITFQPLNLGVPGIAGVIMNACIAIPFWAFVIILAIKLVGAIWPFGSGVPD